MERTGDWRTLLARPADLPCWWNEVKELAEAIREMSWPDIREEAGDVAFWSWMLLDRAWPREKGWPLWGAGGACAKFRRRFQVWERLFQREGLQFSVRYLAGGGNPGRPEKVRRALEMARREQGVRS